LVRSGPILAGGTLGCERNGWGGPSNSEFVTARALKCFLGAVGGCWARGAEEGERKGLAGGGCWCAAAGACAADACEVRLGAVKSLE
jgi:hypothetical protein